MRSTLDGGRLLRKIAPRGLSALRYASLLCIDDALHSPLGRLLRKIARRACLRFAMLRCSASTMRCIRLWAASCEKSPVGLVCASLCFVALHRRCAAFAFGPPPAKNRPSGLSALRYASLLCIDDALHRLLRAPCLAVRILRPLGRFFLSAAPPGSCCWGPSALVVVFLRPGGVSSSARRFAARGPSLVLVVGGQVLSVLARRLAARGPSLVLVVGGPSALIGCHLGSPLCGSLQRALFWGRLTDYAGFGSEERLKAVLCCCAGLLFSSPLSPSAYHHPNNNAGRREFINSSRMRHHSPPGEGEHLWFDASLGRSFFWHPLLIIGHHCVQHC